MTRNIYSFAMTLLFALLSVLLVNLVAHRARQIAAEAEAFQEELPEKPVTLAIQEVADGKLTATVKDIYKN